MENPLNFRVKVDLSLFYTDARKLSYIFVDATKIFNVLHLHTKIQNIFGITKPFYLYVNNVFLPVNEDVRIIKDDEIIVVKPGASEFAGVASTPRASGNTSHSPQQNDIIIDLKTQEPSDSSEDTDIEICDQSKIDISTNDVQIIDASRQLPKKRKRIRRRKPKNEEKTVPITLTKNPLHNGFASTNYPLTKIHHEDNKPTPTHLKFNWDENEEPEKKVNGSATMPLSSKPVVRSTEITSLSTLLNLRNCQRPLTFSGQKRSRTNSVTSLVSKESTKQHESPDNMELMVVSPSRSSKIICNNPPNPIVDYTKINILDYPVYKNGGFEVDDVIAFKILTLNENYCPILSEFIVAKIAAKDHTGANYSCKILMGYDQLKNPDGKFALPTDDDDCEEKKIQEHELITINAGHLDQPRLIYRSTTKG